MKYAVSAFIAVLFSLPAIAQWQTLKDVNPMTDEKTGFAIVEATNGGINSPSISVWCEGAKGALVQIDSKDVLDVRDANTYVQSATFDIRLDRERILNFKMFVVGDYQNIFAMSEVQNNNTRGAIKVADFLRHIMTANERIVIDFNGNPYVFDSSNGRSSLTEIFAHCGSEIDLESKTPGEEVETFEISPIMVSEVAGQLIQDPSSIAWKPAGRNKRVKIVSAFGIPGDAAIQFSVNREPKAPEDVRILAPMGADIFSGDRVSVYFWLRTASTDSEDYLGTVDVVVRRVKDSETTVIEQEIRPTANWKMYKVSSESPIDFPSKSTEFGFYLGKHRQTVEIGPVFIVKERSG